MGRAIDWGKWNKAKLQQRHGVNFHFWPERLTQAREARGISKGELQIAARGLPVGSYENGKRVPNDAVIEELAEALHVLPNFFMVPPDEYEGTEGAGELTICGPEQCPCEAPDCARFLTPDGVEIEACQYGEKPPACQECKRPFTHLCDGLARPDREGKDKRTCDARMCTRHRHRVGPRSDLCGKCFRRETRASKK